MTVRGVQGQARAVWSMVASGERPIDTSIDEVSAQAHSPGIA